MPLNKNDRMQLYVLRMRCSNSRFVVDYTIDLFSYKKVTLTSSIFQMWVKSKQCSGTPSVTGVLRTVRKGNLIVLEDVPRTTGILGIATRTDWDGNSYVIRKCSFLSSF